MNNSQPKLLCMKCSLPIRLDAIRVECKTCSLNFHHHCLLRIFPTIETQLIKNISNENSYIWECFRCTSDKNDSLSYECIFCERSSEFLVRIEVKNQEPKECGKIKWGHLSCIEGRTTCVKSSGTFCYVYQNMENYSISNFKYFESIK